MMLRSERSQSFDRALPRYYNDAMTKTLMPVEAAGEELTIFAQSFSAIAGQMLDAMRDANVIIARGLYEVIDAALREGYPVSPNLLEAGNNIAELLELPPLGEPQNTNR